MPTRLPGRRAVGRAGILTPAERELIEGWFVEGYTVMEVYAKCLDCGVLPPIEHTLYAILRSESVQQQLRTRKAAEAGSRIAQIVERTRSRNRLLEKIEKTVEARADAYAELAPGGDEGLVVFSDRKSVLVGRDSEGSSEYETVDVYKTDTGLIEQWRGTLTDQEKSDLALRRNLRERKADEHQAAMQELEKKKLEMEVERLRAELDALKRTTGGKYEPPTFPAVVVSQLPAPERAREIDMGEGEDEGADPAPPVIPEEE